MIRRFGLVGLGLIALALPARAEGGVVALEEDVAIVAGAGVKVDRQGSRRLAKAARKAFVAAATHLAAFTRTIFYTDRPTPFWMSAQASKDRRVFVVLDPKAGAADRSYDTILASMAAGRIEFRMKPPATEPGPDDLAALWEGMGRAVLAATMYEAAPLWYREGVAAAMADEGSKGAAASILELRKVLKESSKKLDPGAALAATDREAFGRSDGRAVSYAVVRILHSGNGHFLRTVLVQSRDLLRHMAGRPEPALIRKEFTPLMAAGLRAGGAGPDMLRTAIRDWIAAGFPTGRQFSRSKGSKALRRLQDRRRFEMTLSGRFTKASLHGGRVEYHVPWKCKAVVQAGIGAGLAVDVVRFEAAGRGRRDLQTTRLTGKAAGGKGYLLLVVESPNGIRYSWRHEAAIE